MLRFLSCEQIVSDISRNRSAFISWSSNITVIDMATHSRRLESPVCFPVYCWVRLFLDPRCLNLLKDTRPHLPPLATQ